MTDLDFVAIKARADAATPGPWHWWQPPSYDHTGPDLHGPAEVEIAVARGYDESCLEISDADAEFIAHARADVPALLARIAEQREAAENERDRLQARLDTATAHVEELRGQRDDYRARLKATNDEVRRRCIVECAVEAERDAMRPVVEAAEAWRRIKDKPIANGQMPGWQPETRALIAAVDAWRAAQPDQTAPAEEVRWYVMHGHGDQPRHAHSTVMRHDGSTPNPDHVGVEARTWEEARAEWDQTAPTDRPSATESQDRGADDGAGTEGSQAQGGAQGGCGECYDIAHDEMDEREFCDRHAEPAPADPAGLDAAISDGIVAAGAAVDAYVGDGSRPPAAVIIGLSVRAAAPHLRAAALREAADDVARLTAGPAPTSQWGEGYRSGVLASERALRERAGRIGGGE